MVDVLHMENVFSFGSGRLHYGTNRLKRLNRKPSISKLR